MIQRLLFIFILFSLSGYAHGFEHQSVTSTVDGLYIRAMPSLSGEVRGKLGKDETAALIGRSTFSTRIDGRNSYWYKVRGPRGGVGWVFGGYLTIDGETPVSTLEMKWVTRCQGDLAEVTFIEKSRTSAKAAASLEAYCIYLESRESDYAVDYFSPIVDQDRLQLYIAGLSRGSGQYELQIEYRIKVPVCRECAASCFRLQEVSTIRETVEFMHDFSRPVVVGIADEVIFDARLMGLSASVQLYAGSELRGTSDISLPGWPWCA